MASEFFESAQNSLGEDEVDERDLESSRDSIIRNWEYGEGNADIDEAIGEILNYYRKNPGKQERTKLMGKVASVVAGAQGGINPECVAKIKTAASAIEMLHDGSLIHDDVLDESATRRGVASVHSKWGTNIALLSGDVFFARSLAIMSKLNDGYPISQMMKTLRTMTEGQLKETVWASRGYEPKMSELLDVMHQKTGVLFGLSARLGAYFAVTEDLNSEMIDQLDQIALLGEYYGVAFQIRDDIDDIDEDKRAGALTLPLLIGKEKALEVAEDLERKSTFAG